jgi:hypothetical protein
VQIALLETNNNISSVCALDLDSRAHSSTTRGGGAPGV